jgi:signal transduction histidine kinase/CheY-like chemotaxis protein
MLHPDDAPAFMEEFQAALDPEGPGWFERDVRVVKPSGEIRWCRARQQVIFEGEGAERRPDHAIIVAFDITEEKEFQDRLAESDRNKDEFIATLAHELRNPLAPLRSGLDFLRLAGPDDSARARMQNIMERQITHLVRLVDELLDISRISRGKIELRKEAIDVAAIARQVVADLRPLAEANDLSIDASGLDAPLPVVGDPVRVAQMIANLLDNAIKYTESGGAIRVAAERGGGDVRIEVSDTGIGIAGPMLPRVFDLFVQGEAAPGRARAGLGIGLALVRKLATLHGGAVEARSEGMGRGARFLLRLPLSGAPSADAARSDDGSTAGDFRRALIIDDNCDAADTLAEALGRLGLPAAVAYSGAEGVARAASLAAELVLLDLGMPVMDGFETARRLRALPGGENIVIVALTGWGGEEARRRTKDAGFDGHLVKPATIEELIAFFTRPARDGAAAAPRISNAAKMA